MNSFISTLKCVLSAPLRMISKSPRSKHRQSLPSSSRRSGFHHTPPTRTRRKRPCVTYGNLLGLFTQHKHRRGSKNSVSQGVTIKRFPPCPTFRKRFRHLQCMNKVFQRKQEQHRVLHGNPVGSAGLLDVMCPQLHWHPSVQHQLSMPFRGDFLKWQGNRNSTDLKRPTAGPQ